MWNSVSFSSSHYFARHYFPILEDEFLMVSIWIFMERPNSLPVRRKCEQIRCTSETFIVVRRKTEKNVTERKWKKKDFLLQHQSENDFSSCCCLHFHKISRHFFTFHSFFRHIPFNFYVRWCIKRNDIAHGEKFELIFHEISNGVKIEICKGSCWFVESGNWCCWEIDWEMMRMVGFALTVF